MAHRCLVISVSALLIFTFALLLFTKKPLQDVHWDAPIYLERGKEIAEASALKDYSNYASIIAQRLPEYKVEPDAYTPYWGFMRLGHSILISIPTAMTGGGLTGIEAAFVLYNLIWLAGVGVATLLAYRLVRLWEPELQSRVVFVGAILAMLLYLASDACRYMSGNFVAEVPALLWLTTGTYTLVLAQLNRSINWAVLSGVLAFALYVTKMESVWAHLCFMVIFASGLIMHRGERPWWPAFIVSGLCALVLFALYSWWFWPLTDPRLLIIFSNTHQTVDDNPVAPIKLWVVAGGLLWLGLLAALGYRIRSHTLRIMLAWLLLMSIPYINTLLGSGQAQVRMFTLIMPALLPAATVGITAMLHSASRQHSARGVLVLFLGFAAAFAAISHSETYRSLYNLPGGWRLQYPKVFLSPPKYERLSYPIQDLARVSHIIQQNRNNTVVELSDQVSEEYSNIISYLLPPPRRSKIARYAAPHSTNPVGRCGTREIRFEDTHVIYCLRSLTAETKNVLKSTGISVFKLQNNRKGRVQHLSVHGRTLENTPHIVLVREF